jgi:hypothetical protein
MRSDILMTDEYFFWALRERQCVFLTPSLHMCSCSVSHELEPVAAGREWRERLCSGVSKLTPAATMATHLPPLFIIRVIQLMTMCLHLQNIAWVASSYYLRHWEVNIMG